MSRIRTSSANSAPSVATDCTPPPPQVTSYQHALSLAQNGDLPSTFLVGWLCLRGSEGAPKDTRKAFQYFLKASERGHDQATWYVALALLHGQMGTTRNRRQAIRLLRELATDNYAPALQTLASCYRNATGVKRNLKKSFDLYDRAATLGYSQAMYQLGACHEHGLGVPRSLTKAFQQYLRAAEKDNTRAQFEIGRFYARGWVAVDCEEEDRLLKAVHYLSHPCAEQFSPAILLMGKVLDALGKEKWPSEVDHTMLRTCYEYYVHENSQSRRRCQSFVYQVLLGIMLLLMTVLFFGSHVGLSPTAFTSGLLSHTAVVYGMVVVLAMVLGVVLFALFRRCLPQSSSVRKYKQE